MTNLRESQPHSDNTHASLDRSMQLKVTDERLAKLERMYEELSQLEKQAKVWPNYFHYLNPFSSSYILSEVFSLHNF